MKLSLSLVIIFLSGCSVVGISSVDEPDYDVLTQDGSIEIRRYEPTLIATTSVEGNYKQATNEGFKRLASFIFGDNVEQQSMAMTAPVVQQPDSTSIKMTAPVIQNSTSEGWQSTFFMPAKYTKDTLPMPTDDRISIKTIDERTVAVITFSGNLSEEKMQQYETPQIPT